MKFFIALLVGTCIFFSFDVEGQVDSLECERWKIKVEESISHENFNRATSYLLQIEKQCGLDTLNWQKLIRCLVSVVNSEDDSEIKYAYNDTLLNAWVRQEQAGYYRHTDDFIRGASYAQKALPNFKKADYYFQRGMRNSTSSIHESYIVYALYATYVLFDESEGEARKQLKSRVFNDYFFYVDLIDSSMSLQTRETIDTYFEYVFPSCEEIDHEVNLFLDSIPQDTTLALQRIKQMEQLLEDKRCTLSLTYSRLIGNWSKLDPTDLYPRYIKIKGSTNDHIDFIDSLLVYAKDSIQISKLLYHKAYSQYSAGRYHHAYNSGLKCTGEYKSKGVLIAAQSVAALATSCGNSTFERQCNYLYAAQLAKDAGFDEQAGSYRSKAPVVDCEMYEKYREPVYLSCWDVTVYVCP
jgi:hypothetical protein